MPIIIKYFLKILKKNVTEVIQKFFTTGHERSIQLKKNISFSFIINGLMILVGIIRVPLFLLYLRPEQYGIWLTLTSVIGWFTFFDMGFGNGLRNKLGEALAKNEKNLARTYVSTTYAIISIIMITAFILFISIHPLLNWSKILNAPDDLQNVLSILAVIVVTSFTLKFILSLLGTVLIADQRPAVQSTLSALSSIIYLLIIIVLIRTTKPSLILVGIASGFSELIVLVVASIILYSKKYNYLKPSFQYINFKYFHELGTLGIKFFILQVAAIVVFSTDNMIITQICGPEQVVPYNVAFRYLGVLSMIYGIIIFPFWSAYTQAYVVHDIQWIKKTMWKSVQIWAVIGFGTVLAVIFSKTIYHLWLGNKVDVPWGLSIGMGLYVIMSSWNNIYAFFINGVGKIKLQMYYGVLAMLMNIPVSIFFAKSLNMGSTGVILGTCVSLSLGSVLGPIQSLKIINGRAIGIWNK